MLSTKPFSSAKAAREYYSHADYYGSEVKGVWFGDGARDLGLQGEFSVKSDKSFKNIMKGQLPNGQILGKRTKKGIEHRPGLDLTFSCPKSFSIQMLLYAGPEERALLEKAMMKAVNRTLSYIEARGYVETRKAHGVREKLNKLTFATFNHTTNRNLEPQAHVHCFLANVAKCKDGKFMSITYDKILKNIKHLGQTFRNELASELKKLGYKIESKILSDRSSSFELSCIHPKLIRAFSTRRQEIEELCKLRGATTKEERDRIVITSRKAKRSVKVEDLLNTWKTIERNVMKKIEKDDPSRAKSRDTSNFNNITESGNTQSDHKVWQKNEKIEIKQIYNALYNRLPSLLPEFGFVKRGDHYISTTVQKIDGSTGKKGKVYVYANNPGVLVDYTKGPKPLWNYVQERYGLSSNSEIFQYLASNAGFKNATGKLEPRKTADINVQEETKPAKPAVNHKTWEAVYKFSLEKISIPNNQVIKYLEQDRKYSKEIINKMGIGYIASKKELMSYLTSCKVSQSQILEVNKALGYIGSTHKMVMPYYDKEGQIIGFTGRDIKHDSKSELSKYMYSKGLVRNNTLYNIHEIKQSQGVIIVEGMLDCLHAKAQGIKNVVALGGTGFNNKQAELINDLKINQVTICMDNDKAGQEASERIVNLIYDKNPETQIKLVKLPGGIKDPDELLKIHGAEKAIEVINTAELKEIKLKKAEHKEIEVVSNLDNDIDKNDITQSFTVKDLVKLCVEDVTHHQSVFQWEEMSDKAMKYSIGDFSLDEIESEFEKLVESGVLLMGAEGVTTKELLDKEQQILKFAKNGLNQTKPILGEKHFKTRCAAFKKRELRKNPNFMMNNQQKKALKHILTSKDNIAAIVGLPGVGKSTVLNAVRDISSRKIINIIGSKAKFQGAAPTASAAKTLAESAKIDSDTLHSFLGKYHGYIEGRGTTKSLLAMKKRFKKVIIFLDESSLVSTKLMHKLLTLQHKFGFRLVMTGDTKQLAAVEAGKPFEQILSIIPSTTLTKIVRQKDNKHIEAVMATSAGNIKTTFDIHKNNIFDMYNENTKEEANLDALIEQTVGFYLQGDAKYRDNTLLISPTRKLRDNINKTISTELRKKDLLRGKIETFTALRQKDMSIADYRFAPSFTVGDTLRFHATYKKDIKKGDYCVVIAANKITNTLILAKEGKQIRYCLKKNVSYENKFEVFKNLTLELQEGLKIRFTKNNKEFGLINSETAIIEKLEKDNITLKLEDGKVKSIPISQLKHIDYGYCMTIHSAQGKTFNNTIAAISINEWLNNQKSWLVTLSRHKYEFTAFVQDKKGISSYLMRNDGNKLSAMELVGIKPHDEKILRTSLNKDKMNTTKDLQIQI